MVSSVILMAVLFLASATSWASAQSFCSPWEPFESRAMNRLTICHEPPVERQVRQACLRHEWRCGDELFDQWLAAWLAEMREPVTMAFQGNQVVFSGQFGRDHLAMFWTVQAEDKPGFQVLVSRIRPTLNQVSK